MTESNEITLLDHVLERLTNLDVKLDNIDNKYNNIQKEIKFLKQNAIKRELKELLLFINKDEYELFIHKVRCFALQNQFEYFYALGQIYFGLKTQTKLNINNCLTYIWNICTDDTWKNIDKMFVRGHQDGHYMQNINSCSDFWNLKLIKLIPCIDFPNNSDKKRIKIHFNLSDNKSRVSIGEELYTL